MPNFLVEATDAQGNLRKFSVEAASSQEAVGKAKQRGLTPKNVKESGGTGRHAAVPSGAAPASGGAPPGPAAAPASTGRSAPADTAVKGRAKGGKGFILFGRVKTKELTVFTSQLAILMDAGLPIVRSLKILAGQMKPCLLKNIITEISEDVETGSSLSESIAKHPKAFDKLYVNMVKAGEAGGVLDTILQRLAHFMEKAQILKRKVIGALIYPAAVISIAVVILAGIMIFVIPKFKEVYSSLNQTLPALTQLLLNVSEFCAGYWWVVVIAGILLVILIKVSGKTKGGRYTLDKFKLHVPVFGVIIRKSVIARFCRTLGTLIQSGVPILEALAIVKGALGNEVVSSAVSKVHDSIREGETIAEPLAQSGIFDDMVINMIDVGEETGELDKMLMKIADNYELEVDSAVSNLMSILEPILIIGMGLTIGFIVVALFLPLVDLIQGMSGGSSRR